MGEVHFPGIVPPFAPGDAERIEALHFAEQAAASELEGMVGTGDTQTETGEFGLETVYRQCLTECAGDEDSADAMFSELAGNLGEAIRPPGESGEPG